MTERSLVVTGHDLANYNMLCSFYAAMGS